MKRALEQQTLQLALPFVATDRAIALHAGRERHPLQRYDARTLAAARATNRALRLLPDALVTHFVRDLQLPAEYAQLLFVTTPSDLPHARLPDLLLAKLHVPKAACAHYAKPGVRIPRSSLPACRMTAPTPSCRRTWTIGPPPSTPPSSACSSIPTC